LDTGDSELSANTSFYNALLAPELGVYWVQFHISSEFLIPSASFERSGTFVPLVAYSPGDFAVFEHEHRRI